MAIVNSSGLALGCITKANWETAYFIYYLSILREILLAYYLCIQLIYISFVYIVCVYYLYIVCVAIVYF